jgi:outer membrane protein OmpA-like peptidoglycan-associated protein
MQRSRFAIAASLAAACLLTAISTFGAAGEKTEVKGMIVSRTGETLIVNTAKKGKVTVVLTDETRTKDNKGLLGMRKDYMANTVLIPGLKLKVEGVTDEQGRVVAKTITVDGDDLETAEMIQAGLHPTAEQVDANMQAIQGNKQNIATNQQNIATNKQQVDQNIKDIQENTERFSQLGEYDVKSEATVRFDVGSSKLSAEGQEQLKKLAQAASGLKGYIIEVKGFADSTGSAAMNDKLSEDRADAVVSFLIQQANVPVRHIVAPGAMGEYGPAASNETAQGRADNRRVEVKVLVNKGVSGS